MWKKFDGTARSREDTLARINSLIWTDWKPEGITLHNTAAPNLAQWAESGPQHDARIRNLESYYENDLGWHGGPHFFVSRNWINWFSNPLLPGVHSRCFNATRFGLEMVGDFNVEPFNQGDGAMVRDNAVFLIAALNNKFGFDADDLTFHKECTRDQHDCPGHLVVKSDVIVRVKAEMARQKTGATPSVEPKPIEPPAPQVEPQPVGDLPSRLVALAGGSDLAHYQWKDRGHAPLGYIKGMALAFSIVLAKLKANDPAAVAMARQNTNDDSVDAISWFNSNFRAIGMTNDIPGVDVLRHLFVMLTGLGMRESSGKYCEGRDRSANNVAADTSEAGLFQMSWNAHSASPLLMTIFQHYDDPNVDGLLSIFREGVIPSQVGLANFGSGPGARFQGLCKTKPLFAVESAALGLRVIRHHWGPVNRKELELRPEADKLFRSVQEIVGP